MSDKMKLIMEAYRKLEEDNYEDSGEPWDPKSSSYPFQHPQKGLLLRTRNRANFDAWAERWKAEQRKAIADGLAPAGSDQLTKAVRVAPKGAGRISVGSGAPFKRRFYEEKGYVEAWEKIANKDPALAKEVADLVWEKGGGLKMHPHAVELDPKALRLAGEMLSQQTGIEIDNWFSPVLPDDRPPGDMRAIEWKDFIDYALAKPLYYLHKQHGPDVPYSVKPWDEEKGFERQSPSYEDDITLEEMIEAAISEEMAALASEGN